MKFFSGILTLLSAAMLLGGCHVGTKYDKTTGPIKLCPVIGCGVRSGEEFIAFPEEATFRLWAISSETGEKFLDNVSVTSSGEQVWIPQGSPLWPYDDELMFAGFYPESLDATCDSDGNIRIASYSTIDSEEDILIASLSKSYAKTDSLVGVEFHHALSKIDFRVLNAMGSDYEMKVSKIVVKNIYREGSYDSSDVLGWTPSGERSDLVVFEADGEGTALTAGVPAALGDSFFVLPQEEGGASIEITYAFSAGGSAWLTGQVTSTPAVLKGWEPDRHYTYTMKMQDDKLAYTTAYGSWNDAASDE